MAFVSILFEHADARQRAETVAPPECFVDLNLDQLVAAITAGKQGYALDSFFHAPLRDPDAIAYRHEIFRALENDALFQIIQTFAREMRVMREQLEHAAKLFYKHQQERWFVDAAGTYCQAVQKLANALAKVDFESRGLSAFRAALTDYLATGRFTALAEETKQLQAELASVRYCLRIKGNSIQVRQYDGEMDYSAEVEETFAKFRQGAVREHRAKFPNWNEMNRVEARVLDCVAQLYPEIFQHLDSFYARHQDFLDARVRAFDREIQFYVAYLEFIGMFRRAGLSFCYPRVSTTDKRVFHCASFDLALAYKLRNENGKIVPNDFELRAQERILVVTGPNQGGKTTFARMFGQAHYLASLGCPVPGTQAQLFLFDHLLTHFERAENIENLRGKLEDDLFRIHALLDQATPHSILILNEIFNSTTLQDALFLSREILEKIIARDALCVCVTFIDELATLGETTVSMVSAVVPENPTQRTFKILRQRADGLAYALSIAEKYRLTYVDVQARLKQQQGGESQKTARIS